MMSSKTHNGGQKIADRGNQILSQDAVKLLKTQDAGYLRTIAQKTRKARQKIEQEYVLGAGEKVNLLKESSIVGDSKHVFFVGSKEEQKVFQQNHSNTTTSRKITASGDTQSILHSPPQDSDEDDSHLAPETHPNTPAPTKKTIESQQAALKADRALRKQHKREQEARRSKLEALKVRETDLMAAEQELEMQRAKMSNSIGGITKAGVKWKVRERKR